MFHLEPSTDRVLASTHLVCNRQVRSSLLQLNADIFRPLAVYYAALRRDGLVMELTFDAVQSSRRLHS